MGCVQGVQGERGCRLWLGSVHWLMEHWVEASGIRPGLTRHVRARVRCPCEGILPLQVGLAGVPHELRWCAASCEQPVGLLAAAAHQGSAYLPRARPRPVSRHPPLTANPLSEHPQHPLLGTPQLVPPILRELLRHQAREVVDPLRGLAVGAEAEADGGRVGAELPDALT